MKKNKSKNPSESELSKWRQAFQKPAIPDLACPEPELVISSALQELAEPKQQQVQDHLLSCRDCLELYLDVLSTQAEADSGEDRKFDGILDEEPAWAAWLAVLGHKVWEILQGIEGVKIPARYGPPRQGDVRHSQADTAAAVRDLGLSPRFSLEEGLRRTLAWYRSTL